ncbi:MAG: assimilatory sulfite reductase (NADPH) flavoprotein subunit [Flavisolibacter sp.]
MLTGSKLNIFRELVANASTEELAWMSGFFAALQIPSSSESAKLPSSSNKITIAYGSETGNAKKLATGFAAKAKKKGIHAKLVSLEQYKVNDLAREDYFLTVISTQGDGEPPAGAKKFYDHLHLNGFKITGLKYGVLALGDTSYPLFCKAGQDVDEQLNKLGGQRIIDLQKCDTDFEPEAEKWFSEVLHTIEGNTSIPSKGISTLTVKKTSTKEFYSGVVLTNINLNDQGSSKQTHHIEIACDVIDYEPGDSLGLIPENPDYTVESIQALLGMPPEKKILFKGIEFSLQEVLKRKWNIVYLAERVIQKYAAITGYQIPPGTKTGLLELLKIYPPLNEDQRQQIMDIMEAITPRLYSIASSPAANQGEIHLTVARDKFYVNEEEKYGLCSDFFSHVALGTNLNFYIHKNGQFKLPSPDRDIIMVGPGTGIAPFRSFVAERDAKGASGRNWLFFGDQRFVTDFLYQSEWQNWLNTGVVTRMDVAFSRDQKEKIYVQHKMMKQGKDIYQWLQEGAYFYLCGAREPMSIDVENTLLSIIEKYGNKTTEEALTYLEMLMQEDRFLKDVY